jgi:PKD repeat protein
MRSIINTSVLLVLSLYIISCSNDLGYFEPQTVDQNLLPMPNFTASKTNIFQDDSITFTNTSERNPTLFTWEFEGGNPTTSSLRNPKVIYPGKGTFKVSLKARNEHGANTVVKEGFIKVDGIPLDPDIMVKMSFENSLLNEGSVGGSAASTGTPEYTVGKLGKNAYNLKGTNPLTIAGFSGIGGKGPRTVAAWVKTKATVNSCIVNWGLNALNSRNTFRLTPANLRFEWSGGGVSSARVLNDDVWHHVAMTYDGTISNIYVDGIADGTASATAVNTDASGTSVFEIGAQYNANFLVGAIDELYLYKRALTATEIKALKDKTK